MYMLLFVINTVVNADLVTSKVKIFIIQNVYLFSSISYLSSFARFTLYSMCTLCILVPRLTCAK